MLGEGGVGNALKAVGFTRANDLPAGRFIQASVFMLW